MPFAIGMIIALPSEATRLAQGKGWEKSGGYALQRQILPGGIDLFIGLSGMGIGNALRTAEELVQRGATMLVNAGISGGLVTGLRPGDLVIAESVLLVEKGQVSGTWRADRRAAVQAADLLAKGGILSRHGRIMTSVRPVLSASMKKKYGEQFHSLVVDMESAGVAMAAGEAGLPFFIMRAVCDPFMESIPPWLFSSLNGDGSVCVQKLFREVVRRPVSVVNLLRTQVRFRTACGALANAWTLLSRAPSSPFLFPPSKTVPDPDSGFRPHRK